MRNEGTGDGGRGTGASQNGFKLPKPHEWTIHDADLQDLFIDLEDQQQLCDSLERRKKFEQTKLETMQQAASKALIACQEAQRVATSRQVYDDDLSKQLSQQRLQDGFPLKKTKAIPWAELRKRGATDGEIRENLHHLKTVAFDRRYYQVIWRNKDLLIVETGPGLVRVEPIVEGSDAVLKDIRRIMDLGKATMKKPATPSTKKKPAKKSITPQVKKKPAASPKKVTQPVKQKVVSGETTDASDDQELEPAAAAATGTLGRIVAHATGRASDNSRRRPLGRKKPK